MATAKRRAKKPTVKAGVADHYAAAGERIVEFSTPAGRGGLISVRDLDDLPNGGPRTVVSVYRCDEGVVVEGGPKESWDDRKAKFTAADFLGHVLGFLTAACEHYEKSAPTVRDHCDELYRRMGENMAGVSVWEVTRVLQLRDLETLAWEQANVAANAVYKLRHELGMDVTGHAGF